MTGSIVDLVNSQRNSGNQIQRMSPQPQVQQIKSLMNQLKNMPNPQIGLYNVLASNPQYRNFVNLMQMGSGNWQQVAQTMANQQGIDLNNLIQELQN